MKETMTKVALFAFHEDRAKMLSALQRFGAVHIETDEERTSERLDALLTKKKDYTEAIRVVKEASKKTKRPANVSNATIEDDAQTILSLQRAIDDGAKEIDALNAQRALLSAWGDFDRDKLFALVERGFTPKFYAAQKKDYRAFAFKDAHETIFRKGSLYSYLVFKPNDEEREYPGEEILLPKTSISKIDAATMALRNENTARHAALADYGAKLSAYQTNMLALEDDIQYERARANMDEIAEGKAFHATGWIPSKKKDALLRCLDEIGGAYALSEPARDDATPVILKSNSYTKPFQTITKLFQLPNYFEFDLTPFISVFYPIFFGTCLGDAGYGAMLLAVSLIAMIFLKRMRSIAALGIILGVFTTAIGILNSGTVFGVAIASVQNVPLFAELSKFIFIKNEEGYFLSPFNTALLMGIAQIHVAIIINIIKCLRYDGFLAALSPIGKLLLLPSLIVMFLHLMQGMAIFDILFPWYFVTMGVGAFMLIFLTALPKLNLLDGVLNVYFAVTGVLGDVLSYIRLFALGLSGGILGLVINQLGASFASIPGIGIAVAAVFLVVGHGANFALSGLSAFVHPLRLTFVEFYNNADFKGGGIAYNPLRKRANAETH